MIIFGFPLLLNVIISIILEILLIESIILHNTINVSVFLFIHFHSSVPLQYQSLRFSFH